MPDLRPVEVQGLLAAIGLEPEDADDLEEITHRLNAIREALLVLDVADLDATEPLTIFGPDEARS